MALVTTASVVRQIESLFDGGSVAGLSDGQLIERFKAATLILLMIAALATGAGVFLAQRLCTLP